MISWVTFLLCIGHNIGFIWYHIPVFSLWKTGATWGTSIIPAIRRVSRHYGVIMCSFCITTIGTTGIRVRIWIWAIVSTFAWKEKCAPYYIPINFAIWPKFIATNIKWNWMNKQHTYRISLYSFSWRHRCTDWRRASGAGSSSWAIQFIVRYLFIRVIAIVICYRPIFWKIRQPALSIWLRDRKSYTIRLLKKM